MMNQYYGFTGRSARVGGDRATERGYDRSPYRRPTGRGGIFPYGSNPAPLGGSHPGSVSGNAMGGGCGCRGNRQATHYEDQGHGHGGLNHGEHGQSRPVMNRGGGCGCGNNRQEHHDHQNCGGSCGRLMDQIRAVDFALYETVLYLDVYPDSCDALETYHKLREQSKALHEEYESTCGPLTAFGNKSVGSWDWMSKPCPWEYEAE